MLVIKVVWLKYNWKKAFLNLNCIEFLILLLVVGVPDERSGELPRAYVVRKNRNVMEQSIIDWVAERVAPHKKLGAGVMFVETLPKNQTGKILRRELKAQVFKGSFGY